MGNSVHDAFDEIHADDALLEKTAAFLRAERQKREKQRRSRRYPRMRRLGAAFAAALALAVGFWGGGLYFTPAAYVSIDLNPSVELTLNRMDRVIGAHAFNAEGEQLLQQNKVTGKAYDRAVATLIASMEEGGYFREGALLSLTVQSADSAKEQALCDTLRQAAPSGAGPAPAEPAPATPSQTGPAAAAVSTEVFAVSAEVRESAQSCRMSPAKYLAVQELMEVDETATPEQYADASIQQIRQRTQQCREAHGSIAGGGHENGHGNTAPDNGTAQDGDAEQSGGSAPEQGGGKEQSGGSSHGRSQGGRGHGGNHHKGR